MKRYLAIEAFAAAILVLVGLGSSAGAAELPKRFWGKWITIDGSDPPADMTLSGTTITFGQPPPSCKFTKIDLANEERTAFSVNWHCPEQVAGVEIKTVFRLMKIWGKEALLIVNAENPETISVYQRRR
jgi:hypothetical protein